MLPILLSACTGGDPVDSSAPHNIDSIADDTGEPLPTDDSGTTPDEVEITGVEASLSGEIGMVVTVTWQSNRTDSGAVRFGVGEDTLGTATAALSEGTWTAVLVGIPAATVGWFSVGHDDTWTEPEDITTNEVTSFPDPVEVSGDVSGYTLTTFIPSGGAKMHPVIFNGQGELVWWHTYDGQREGFSSRLLFAPDRQSLYYNVFHITLSAPSSFAGIINVSLDGETVETIDLPDNHHDFLIHDDGTIAFLRYDRREVSGQTVAGDAIIERSPDGSEVIVWTSWDHMEWDGTGTITGGGMFWTLANSLEYDADRDQYLMSARDRNGIIAVDRSSGETDWILGGVDGTLSLTEQFVGQHGFARDGEDLLVFDNRGAGTLSRVIRYTLEEASATTVWVHNNEPQLFTEFFGDVQPLPSGDLLVAWGKASRLSVLDADQQTTSVRAWDSGAQLGFVQQEERLVQ